VKKCTRESIRSRRGENFVVKKKAFKYFIFEEEIEKEEVA